MTRLVALALIAVCASGVAAQGGLWLDVPYVRQTEKNCGPAALSMLLQYWAQRAPGLAIAPKATELDQIRAKLPGNGGGVLASALVDYLQKLGFRVFPIRGTWDDLRPQVEQGRPMIAAIRSGGAKLAHFVVVVGVENDAVLINDPARRKLMKLPRADWEREWKAGDNWLLVAAPGE